MKTFHIILIIIGVLLVISAISYWHITNKMLNISADPALQQLQNDSGTKAIRLSY